MAFEITYGEELHEAKLEDMNERYLEALDNCINVEVIMPDKNGTLKSRVVSMTVGEANNNPILDTRLYEFKFPDGRVEEYAVNMIAENLFEQADEDRWDIIEEFLDIQKDDSIALSKEDGTYFNNADMKRYVVTTKGWEVHVKMEG